MTGDITLAELANIVLDASGSADERWTGITIPGVLGATIAVGDLCYLGTSLKWLLADADAEASAGGVMLGICLLAGNDTNATTMLLYGTIRSAKFPASMTVARPVYVSTTGGQISSTAATGSTDIVRIVGYTYSTEPNTIFFNPSKDYFEIS